MTKKFTTKATPEKPKKPRKWANSDNPLTISDSGPSDKNKL